VVERKERLSDLEKEFYHLTRIFHETLAATTDMDVLPGVLECSFDYAQDKLTLRGTVQVRLETNTAVPRDGCQVAHPSSWSRDSNS
jgi:hypothetical protein